MNKHLSLSLILVMFSVGLVSLQAADRSLDITRVDLFSLKRWNSTQVCIDGLRLEMPLPDAKAALLKRGLGLFDQVGQGPCRAGSRICYVARQATADGTAVTIELGPGGRIIMVDVGVPEDPATLPSTIAGRFKGMTREFFFHYSDEFRLKLLGPPDRVKKSPTADAIQVQRYTYDRLGLVVYTNRYLRRAMKRPSAPELSSIEFVMPKAPHRTTNH